MSRRHVEASSRGYAVEDTASVTVRNRRSLGVQLFLALQLLEMLAGPDRMGMLRTQLVFKAQPHLYEQYLTRHSSPRDQLLPYSLWGKDGLSPYGE